MPFSIPCANPVCPGYTDRLGSLCSECRPRPICPRCGGHIETVTIRGKAYRVAKRTQIAKRYDLLGKSWVSDNDALRIQPIPLLIVEKKGA